MLLTNIRIKLKNIHNISENKLEIIYKKEHAIIWQDWTEAKKGVKGNLKF